MFESGLYTAKYCSLVKKKMTSDSHKQIKFLAKVKKIKFEPCNEDCKEDDCMFHRPQDFK